jgi:hypothetical protein
MTVLDRAPGATTRSAAADVLLAAESEHVAHNYHPLEVVVSHGHGAVVTDVDGTTTWTSSRRTPRRTSGTATRASSRPPAPSSTASR